MKIFVLEENGLGFISAHATIESAKKHLSEITEFYKLSDEMVKKLYTINDAYLYGNDFDYE